MTRQQLIDFIQGNIYPNGRNQITAPMVRDSVLAVVSFMGDAAELNIGSVVQNDPNVVTGGAVYNAINSALSSAIKFQGITTTPLTDGSTQQNILIDGQVYTAKRGDEVIYGGKEFLWTGSKWQQLGDEESWALKTISITGYGYLTGGGNLEQNRTIDISATVKGYIDHGESAYNALGNYATITALNAVANRVTTLELRTNWDDYFGVDQDGNIYVKPNENTPRNFSNAGGVASGGLAGGGGGGGGVDIEQMWQSLKNEAYPGHYTDVIATAHIPDLEISKITGLTTALAGKADASALTDMATMTWVGQQGYATQTWVGQQGYATQTWVGQQGYITGINSTMVTNALGYTPANVTALADYLPLTAGSGKALTGNLYVGSRFIVRTERDSGHGSLFIGDYAGGYDDGIFYVGAGSDSLSDNWFRIQSQSSILITADQTNLYSSDYTKSLYIDRNGYFTVGGHQTTYKLHVAGTFNASTIYENGTALSSKYLSLSGGTISNGSDRGLLFLDTTNTSGPYIQFKISGIAYARVGAYGTSGAILAGGTGELSISASGMNYSPNGGITNNTVLHSGNYSSYALSLSGGTINGSFGALNIKRNAFGASGIKFSYTNADGTTEGTHGYIGFDSGVLKVWDNNESNAKTIYHSGNSNLSTVPWSASSLTLAGAISGATNIDSLLYFDTTNRTIAADATLNPYSVLVIGHSGYNHTYLNFSPGGTTAFQFDGFSQLNINRQYNGNWYCSMTILNSGSAEYIGINKSNPQYTLDVAGVIASTSCFKRIAKSTHYGDLVVGDAGIGDDGIFYNSDSDQWFRIQSQSCIYISATQGTSSYATRPDLFIDKTTGYLGAGTTNPQYKLDVVGVIYSSQGYASPGYVASGGNVASSDARLKSMVETVTYDKAKEIINSLYPKEWVWNEKHYASGKRGAGLIAQQVEDVLPFAIIEKGGYKYLNYDVLNAYEIALLQGHETRIDRLERENRELRKEIETLRTHINS